MNLTKPFKFGAIIVALCTLLTYTNLLSSTISNLTIVATFGIIYLIFCAARGGFSLLMLIPITGAFAIIFLNQDPTMISLALIWMIYDIITNSEIDRAVIAKSFFITGTLGYLVVIAAYFTIGLNKHADLTMWRVDHIISRASLGFQQPNASMLYVLSLAIAYVIAYKLTWTRYIVGIGIISGLFVLNQSRTGFLLVILLLTLTKFNIRWPFPRLTFMIIAGLSYALMVLPINEMLDSILSGRLALYQSYRAEFGIHPIGNPMVDNAMIDNGYIQMLLSKGWVFCLFFVVSMFIVKSSKTRLASIVFAVYILSSFTETTFLHLDILIPMLLIITETKFNTQKGSNLEKKTVDINCSTNL